MIDRGRKNLLGIGIDAVDYAAAVKRITTAARQGQPCSVSALAVHGVMTGHTDEEHRVRLNKLDLVVPDGQPVRWALNTLHGVNLPDRVYGPTLTLKVCEAAAAEGLSLYLYGSTPEVLAAFQENLTQQFPGLQIAGAEPSKFRTLDTDERAEVIARIISSGAKIVLVGLGCPRQEVWAYEYRDELSMPILAVGAAFDFHAGTLSQAPAWMQDRGLEWLYRLKTEPRRLWRRYLILNPWYVYLVVMQRLGWRHFGASARLEPAVISYG